MPAFPYMHVDGADSTCRWALAAQAIPLKASAAMPSGDRRPMVKDAYGNVWQIATRPRDCRPTSFAPGSATAISRAVSTSSVAIVRIRVACG